MGSFITKAATAFGAAALAAAPAAAYAQPSAHHRTTINVGCSHTALVTAVTTANSLGIAKIRLSAHCTYNFTTAVTATNDALPIITGNVTILGGPSTVIRRDPAVGTAAFRIFEVGPSGTLRADGFFILNGAPAAGVPGAGIENAGVLHLVNVTIENNATNGANGGGVDNTASGTAVISRTVISDNTAATGAGGGIANSGALTLSESRVSGNSATSATLGGGGLATLPGATSHVIQSTLDRNTATNSGGGIHNAGTTTLTNTLVERNTATVSGGGIFNVLPGTVSLHHSIVRLNTPNNCFPLGSILGCVG